MPFDLDWACSSQGSHGGSHGALAVAGGGAGGLGRAGLALGPLVKRAAMSGVARGEDVGQCRAAPC